MLVLRDISFFFKSCGSWIIFLDHIDDIVMFGSL